MAQVATQHDARGAAARLLAGDPAWRLVCRWRGTGGTRLSGEAKLVWLALYADCGLTAGSFAISTAEAGRITGAGDAAGRRALAALLAAGLIERSGEPEAGLWQGALIDPREAARALRRLEADPQGELWDGDADEHASTAEPTNAGHATDGTGRQERVATYELPQHEAGQPALEDAVPVGVFRFRTLGRAAPDAASDPAPDPTPEAPRRQASLAAVAPAPARARPRVDHQRPSGSESLQTISGTICDIRDVPERSPDPPVDRESRVACRHATSREAGPATLDFAALAQRLVDPQAAADDRQARVEALVEEIGRRVRDRRCQASPRLKVARAVVDGRLPRRELNRLLDRLDELRHTGELRRAPGAYFVMAAKQRFAELKLDWR